MSIKDYVDAVAPPSKWLNDIQTASKRRGTHQLTMRQIDAEIAAARREQQKKQKVKQPIRRLSTHPLILASVHGFCSGGFTPPSRSFAGAARVGR